MTTLAIPSSKFNEPTLTPCSTSFHNLRVAIVHEWLSTYGGSERVLEQMLQVVPQADVFALLDFIPPAERGFLLGKSAQTSFLQHMPLARTRYRSYLPLMPFAIEQFDLSEYDIVISSSHAVAKGVLTGPDQLHICMCYTPIRYAWDLQHQYLREAGLQKGIKSMAARWMLHRVRLWDYRTAAGVDDFIAISKFIARRISKIYGRSSTVMYPPVDTDRFTLHTAREDFYLAASRMVPYKRMGLIVDAFAAMPDKQLVVIGDGPGFAKVSVRKASNITFLGFQPFESLRDHMQRARAFVFAACEDFGIAPVEAQACGTPVIAFGKGGVGETIVGLESEKPTGVLFLEQTIPAIQEAVQVFEREQYRITSVACRENAELFGIHRFREEFASHIAVEWNRFVERLRV